MRDEKNTEEESEEKEEEDEDEDDGIDVLVPHTEILPRSS